MTVPEAFNYLQVPACVRDLAWTLCSSLDALIKFQSCTLLKSDSNKIFNQVEEKFKWPASCLQFMSVQIQCRNSVYWSKGKCIKTISEENDFNQVQGTNSNHKEMLIMTNIQPFVIHYQVFHGTHLRKKSCF